MNLCPNLPVLGAPADPQVVTEESWRFNHMTLQVCFIGSDGIVLASDTRRVEMGPSVVTSTMSAPKISMDASRRFAWCGAGDPIVGQVCAHIGELISDTPEFFSGEPTVPLRDAGRKIRDSQRWGDGNKRIFFASASMRSFWLLDMNRPVIEVTQPHVKCVIGDSRNAAVFFPEYYFPDEMTSVDNLLPLAAHTILMGSKCNPSWVEGLEIAVSKAGKFRRLTEFELNELTLKSATIDSLIRGQLGLGGSS
jgi:hypothetical protein